jgi:hypothetical protein
MFLRTLLLLTGLVAGLVPGLASAQASLEVIDLQHRSADELLPLLQPLVEPEGSVAAYENRLIVRATPAQLAEVRALLAHFDRPARQLLISVRHGSLLERQQRSAGVSGSVRRGSGAIVVPRADGSLPDGVEVEWGDQRRQEDRGASQQLRVEEGREAQIFLGSSSPVVTTYQAPDGSWVRRSESRAGGSGFTVLPRVQGDRVQLQITLRQAIAALDGRPASQAASTVVSGRLGEWFEIGGAVQQVSASGRGLAGAEEYAGRSSGSLLVKVEEVP